MSGLDILTLSTVFFVVFEEEDDDEDKRHKILLDTLI